MHPAQWQLSYFYGIGSYHFSKEVMSEEYVDTWRCIGNNKIRIVKAQSGDEAMKNCMQQYGFHPETVEPLTKGVDKR